MELTDEQIKQALECCSEYEKPCKGNCPLGDMNTALCIPVLANNTLDLINRKDAEIEQLKSYYKESLNEKIALCDVIIRQKAEVERLNGCVKSEDEVRTIAETVIQSRIKTIRTETVKDFMKMLTKVWGHYPLNFMTSVDAFYSTVKQIAREMVGDSE